MFAFCKGRYSNDVFKTTILVRRIISKLHEKQVYNSEENDIIKR